VIQIERIRLSLAAANTAKAASFFSARPEMQRNPRRAASVQEDTVRSKSFARDRTR